MVGTKMQKWLVAEMERAHIDQDKENKAMKKPKETEDQLNSARPQPSGSEASTCPLE